MIIHVVKPGESLYSIASLYGVPYSKIQADNELPNPNQLVVGQTIVILEGTRRHTVSQGESIYTIARRYGIGVQDILSANPQITSPAQISPGETITIPERTAKLGNIEVNGYAFPSIDMNVLRKTLPNLTYLAIFSHEVNTDGTLREINDVPLIQAARAAHVAPLLVITNIEQGGSFSSDVARAILRNGNVQDSLLENVITTIRTKNYYGLDIDFEYIYPEDKEYYNNFLRKASARLRPLGIPITTALAPKTSADQPGLLYRGHDYPVHGALTNHVVIMTYEWGFTYGPPQAVSPINEVRKVLDYAITVIPRNKILMGIPNYGYDWTLPFVQGSAARTLSNVGAVTQAASIGAAIQYDNESQAPFYTYYDSAGKQHEVWFEDARSIDAKLRTVSEYRLGGISYWTIGKYFPQNWLVQNALFNVEKVI